MIRVYLEDFIMGHVCYFVLESNFDFEFEKKIVKIYFAF